MLHASETELVTRLHLTGPVAHVRIKWISSITSITITVILC